MTLSMDAQRFHEKYVEDEVTGCWRWKGKIGSSGGRFCTGNKTYLAHRYAYELLVAQVPPGMIVRQRCGNRACVAPAHLEVVLPTDLVIDRTPTYWQRVLSDDAVKEIRNSTVPGREMAKKHHVSVQTVSNIRNWKTYRNVR